MTLRSPLPLALAALTLAACDSGGDPSADMAPVPDGGADMAPDPAGFSLRYHRADGDYAGFTLRLTGDVTAAEVEPSATDDFGAVFALPLAADAAAVDFQLVRDGIASPADPMTVSLDPTAEGIWYFEGGEAAYTHAPPAVPGPDQVVVHYLRDDGMYDGWGLHLWGDVVRETGWQTPAIKGGVDERFGAWWVVDVVPDADRINVIVHAGDTKDPGPDMGWNIADLGDIVFLVTGSTDITPYPVSIPALSIRGAAAHWIDTRTLVWDAEVDVAEAALLADPDGGIEAVDGRLIGGETWPLTETDGLTPEQAARWPHLARMRTFTLPDEAPVDAMLAGQLVVVGFDTTVTPVEATTVQTAGALDALYAYDGPLGIHYAGRAPTLHLWAPTARAVRVLRFDADLDPIGEAIEMTRGERGVWTLTGADDWYGTCFQYELEVYHHDTGRVETVRTTDPYSVSLSRDSTHTHLVDLADPALAPEGWHALQKPPLAAPTDVSIYELHVRDFSAFDETVPPAHRGKYLAFTHIGEGALDASDGMSHLRALAEAGLTVLHLLPAFDIATVREDPAERVELSDPVQRLCDLGTGAPASLCAEHGQRTIAELLASYDPASPDAQALHAWIRPSDAFNWGYDPFHYTAPEGSYATEAHGADRIVEFRRMVMALSAVGLRVAMDVVYNHTHASGLGDQSVLDKIVPGYYHRRNVESGAVENSTCCANTASEHAMMERLMIDSVLTWATAYKIDAFRFDLMGHHMKRNMLALRDALRALTVEADGVDGEAIYLYGEGWNFGEVQSNARGENAIQENMGGTGIGTFNDRIRDGVRGGGPFDSGLDLRLNQGFANGLVTDPNDAPGRDAEADLERLLETTDHIRLGMAANLEVFKLENARGAVTSGRLLSYNGARAGYADDPQDVVNYVSKHDNQTLFDNHAYKAPAGTPMSERLRMQIVALATVALGQGIPFFHAGSDLLRSKSMERDSYDSGDWFNRLDWSMETNNWNVGLPREDKDGPNWDVIRGIIADDSIAPARAHIEATAAMFRELLAVRYSTPLFRLRTGAEVIARVDFHNTGPEQVPGLIAMTITDGLCAGADLDPALDGLVVLINAAPEARVFALPAAEGRAFALHPILAASADERVREAAFADGAFTVPGRTAAVFVLPQGEMQREGLPCNTR